MLLNWDGNELYLSPLIAGLPRGIDLSAAKNLVLELTYSVAYHVQALIQELCYRTIRSMSEVDEHHNPTTICCALWIIFTATHKFEKRNFTATSLTNLVSAFSTQSTNVLILLSFVIFDQRFVQRNFLSKLHERSRAAFQSINQYKWMTSARCCSYARDNQGDFAKLIAEAKRPKATASFAFERHVTEGLMFLHGSDILNSGCDQSQTLKQPS